jgi:aryl-phospho-beta-D-glucosidase BglC (GH1 family)
MRYARYELPSLSKIVREGIYLRSRTDGRYLLLRGVCFGANAKYAPFLAIEKDTDWPRLDPYLKILRACGFNVLRLAFSWEALEPTCDPKTPKYDKAYLKAFFKVAERLSEYGFLIFIDVHQDLLQTAYGGDGFPHWIKEDGAQDGATMLNTPLWGLNYIMNKGLRRSLTQFWKNDITNSRVNPPLVHFPARDRLLDVISVLAEQSAQNERIIGIEVVNEPHPAELNAEKFESEFLPEFYKQAIDRVRKYSADLFVMVSPQSDWNANLRENKHYQTDLAIGEETDDRLIFAFHYYDSLLTGLHGLHFHDRKREEYMEAMQLGVQSAKERGIVPFLTEFGSRQNWLKTVTRRHMHWHFEAVERALVHATYWNVSLYNTKQNRDGFMREDFSLFDHHLRPRNLDLATRPYPIAWSAKPSGLSYNDRVRTFECSMQGRAVAAPTVIYLPFTKQVHKYVPHPYSSGFKVYYGSGKEHCRVTFLPNENQLKLTLDPTAESHHIMIVPQDEFIIANREQLVFECGPGGTPV